MRVGILYGGISPEREVSLKSGKFVCDVLKDKGIDVVLIDVGRDIDKRLDEEKIDVAYISLHGGWGESGAIQGLLEIKGIPFTGSGLTASTLALHKDLSKRLFVLDDIPIPDYMPVYRDELEDIDVEFLWNEMNKGDGVIVKPEDQGSTIGVSVVKRINDLKGAMMRAFEYSDIIVVEEFIPSVEVTAAIIDDGVVLPLIEIVPKEGIYDYRAKYTKGMTDYIIPARIDEDVLLDAEGYALDAYHCLGCEGIARVDMLVSKKDNSVYVLEVNTSPGMTETSLVPKAIRAAGMDIGDVLVREVERAVMRGRRFDAI